MTQTNTLESVRLMLSDPSHTQLWAGLKQIFVKNIHIVYNVYNGSFSFLVGDTFIFCQSDFFTKQKKKSISVKRPYWSFIYIHLIWQWNETGRHPGGLRCWFRWDPGGLSWSFCLTTAPQYCLSFQPDIPQISLQHKLVVLHVKISHSATKHYVHHYVQLCTVQSSNAQIRKIIHFLCLCLSIFSVYLYRKKRNIRKSKSQIGYGVLIISVEDTSDMISLSISD